MPGRHNSFICPTALSTSRRSYHGRHGQHLECAHDGRLDIASLYSQGTPGVSWTNACSWTSKQGSLGLFAVHVAVEDDLGERCHVCVLPLTVSVYFRGNADHLIGYLNNTTAL